MARKSKPGGGVRFRYALRTASGRRRSTESLTQRLVSGRLSASATQAVQREIRGRLRAESRAAAGAAAIRNIPGAEFMSPSELRAAARSAGGGGRGGRRAAPGAQSFRERSNASRNRQEQRAEFRRRVFG